MIRHASYSFPVTVLDAGKKGTVKVDLGGPFRPTKLVMVGAMAEIRGDFRIKRSRLPLLDRDDVLAYSSVRRYRRGKIVFLQGRTTIEYRGAGKHFTRTYLPSNVEYIPTDPLSYIALRNLFCDAQPQMPTAGEGVDARFFGPFSFGNSLPLSTASSSSVELLLENDGDVQVRVHAMLFGYNR